MKKFWNKAETTNDIYIYGDICSGDKWNDSDTTAKSFADDLNSFNGGDVTVHINSGGGSVFDALAIGNVIRNYTGKVTVSIDGLAASAASLIAVSGDHVKAASNSLIMIHSPSVGLCNYYDAESLAKVQQSLKAVEASIIATYELRCKKCNVRDLVKAETWLTAEQAQEYGFVDEITGAVDMQIDDVQKMIFVNSLAISTKNFDAGKMRQAMEAKTMTAEVEKKYLDSIRQQEIGRIKALQALRGNNAAVNAIIDVALEKGHGINDVKPYVDAITALPVTPSTAAEEIKAVIREQMQSGAAAVSGGQEPPDPKELQKKRIADIANSMM